MSRSSDLSKCICQRCGVSFASTDADATVCANCRERSASPDPTTAMDDALLDPLDDEDEPVIVVTCKLCHSQLLVDATKVGTDIQCSDCHSTVRVVGTPPKRKNKRARGGKTAKPKQFDPDAELAMGPAVSRPDLDDLLTSPLSLDAPDPPLDSPTAEPEDAAATDEPTRRERYQRLQDRVLAAGRAKMRQRRRQKKRDTDAESSDNDLDDSPTVSRKSRRTPVKHRRRAKLQGPNALAAALEWLKHPTLVLGWLCATGLLGYLYYMDPWWHPLAFIRQLPFVGIEPGAGGPESSTRTLIWLAVWVAANLLLWFVCGRAFAQQAHAASDDGQDKPPAALFTTLQFGFAWLLTGLPFLWLSILTVPVQILLFAPLLTASWRNRSVWQVVGDPVPETPAKSSGKSRRRKKKKGQTKGLYGTLGATAALSALPAMLIHSGGWFAAPGMLVLSGIMIVAAGLCGRHCREIGQPLEPNA